ncbi:C40 family peptidase [Ornithinimicrobium tianjinense]|uniref:NlpC/P60 domain-containing protein n=1 Tax=Ornithinimicrobium tianjinense TaxID=1195761 RepID=A0A917BGM0_9MICO|nr:C40 family peptidase [Ornithinimicrobium tianjinense]GGF38329.1 hypothetical protein GCM10011366_02380 [Ornithinimicrobium tianjinense]
MTHRHVARHRKPGRISTASTTLSRTAAVAATSTGLIAGAAASATAAPAPSDQAPGLAGGSQALLDVVDKVVAAERPAVAAKAPAEVDAAVAFGTAGFTGSEVVQQQAQTALADRESDAASRTSQERTAAPAPAATPAAPAPAATPAAPAPAPAPAPVGGSVLDVAAAYTGIYYVWGGTTPAGFDCSGYTQWVFREALGIELPRTAAQQQAYATPVSNPQPGDLVFYGYPAYHIGIYAGNGMMYDSGKPGIPSQLRPMFDGVSGFGRVG